MSTFALLICLVAADPLEEIKARIDELASGDPVVVREAYERLQVLTRSPNRARAEAAKAAVAEYELRNPKPAARKSKFSSEELAKFSPEELEQVDLIIHSAKDFYNKNKVLRYTNPRLIDLAIDTTDFGDEQLRPILDSERMMIFVLHKTAVTGRDFAKLRMPRLTILTLEGSPVGDDEVCALKSSNLPELNVLDLKGTKVTDKALAECQLTDIKSLYISDTAVTPAGMRSMTRFPSLITLRMDVRAFDPVLFTLIAEGKSKIKILRLAYTAAEEEAAKAVEKSAPAGLEVDIYRK